MKYLVTACCFALSTVAHADPEPLTLDEAVRIAVERNPQLAGLRVDAEIASSHMFSATGAQDFVLGGNIEWDGTRNRSDGKIPYSDTIGTTTSLTRPLPGGGSVGVQADSTVSRGLAASLAAGALLPPGVDYVTSHLLLVLRQPLLRGWNGDAAPERALERTQASLQVAVLERDATAATQVRDVVRAYWEVAFARDSLAIRRLALANAHEQLRITRARVASGRMGESETLAVEKAIAVREDNLAQAETALVASSLALAELLGREATTPIVFEPTDLVRDGGVRDLEREVHFALERSPELATVRARGRAAAIEVEVTANGMLPQLDLQATGGFRGDGTSPGDSWNHVVDAKTPVFTVGVAFALPVSNRAARGAHAAAVQSRARVKLDERALTVQIQSAVVEATTVMASARQRIQSLEQALKLGDEAIRAERARWEAGKSTNYDVLLRQGEYEDAALRVARAHADLAEAEASLDMLTGAILPRYHVVGAP
jgi:outer membrane protein TolC